MRIENVRLGFACNSSSTHSIILAGTAKGDDENCEFGWQCFLQETKSEKAAYLMQTFKQQASTYFDASTVNKILESIFGPVSIEDGYVDHQSLFTIPLTSQQQQLAVDFYKDLCRALLNDQTAHIQGGNDNSDYDKGQSHDSWSWFWNRLQDRSARFLRCRKQDTVWTVFDKGSGTKIRIDFANAQNQPSSLFKPKYPELIDVKISDYCERYCEYCYQASTARGKHARMENLQHLISSLKHKDAAPFEIALGGGEPTKHPEFAVILEYLHTNDIVPTFTTRSLDWLNDTRIVDAVRSYVGSFAFSIDTAEECSNAITKFREHNLAYKLNFQYILDAHPLANFEKILDVYDYIPLILLGYKEQGRAVKRPYQNTGWLSSFLSFKDYGSLGIDTLLATQYLDELKRHEINERLYYVDEGKFSMYIDAVNNLYGKSSYSGIYYPLKGVSFLTEFGRW